MSASSSAALLYQGSKRRSEAEDESAKKRVQLERSPRLKGAMDNAGPKGNQQSSAQDKELWREGTRSGFGPGKEIFIKKPRLRGIDNIPYRDSTIHPNTLMFLQELANNNDRAWFKAHDVDYIAAKKDWEAFVDKLSQRISEADSTVPELPAKDLVFRIHRDTRFSKNPTPYTTRLSAAWSRTGRKGPYAAYYLQLEPGSCFIEAGLWKPDPDQLRLLREEINQNSHRLKSILNEESVRREFFDGLPGDEQGIVQAFSNQNKGSALKTRPKGYSLDNGNIGLLRLRSYTISKSLSDEELMGQNAQENIVALISILAPFVTYLNSVVMPD